MTKPKRIPYQPKVNGTMYFPMEFDDTDLEFIKVAKYTGCFSSKNGHSLIFSKRRLFNVQLHFCIRKNEKYDVIHYEIKQPLLYHELSKFIYSYGNKEIQDSKNSYDIKESWVFIKVIR